MKKVALRLLTPGTIAAGGAVTVNWSGLPSPAPADRIGLYAPGASAQSPIDWIYLSCSKTPGAASASGSCAFTVPTSLANGSYELRLLKSSTGASATTQRRGFTGHEMLDEVGLVHMNGRVYDPSLGRFMTADTFIQFDDHSQSFNRYSYVLNNPLSFTDPSGNFLQFLAIAVGYAFQSLIAAGGYEALGAIVGGAVAGGIAGEGDPRAALQGAVSGALFSFAHANFKPGTIGTEGFKVGQFAGKVATHAIGGGAISKAFGGSFREGALSAGFGAVAGSVPGLDKASLGRGEIVARAVIGGVSAELGGGKFANGAATAAFGYLMNDCAEAGCFPQTEPDTPPLCNCAKEALGGIALGAGLAVLPELAIARVATMIAAEELAVTNVTGTLVNASGRGGIAAAQRFFDALPRVGSVTTTRTPLGRVQSTSLEGGGTASIRNFSQSNPQGATVQINSPGSRTIKIRYD